MIRARMCTNHTRACVQIIKYTHDSLQHMRIHTCRRMHMHGTRTYVRKQVNTNNQGFAKTNSIHTHPYSLRVYIYIHSNVYKHAQMQWQVHKHITTSCESMHTLGHAVKQSRSQDDVRWSNTGHQGVCYNDTFTNIDTYTTTYMQKIQGQRQPAAHHNAKDDEPVYLLVCISHIT